MIVNSINVSMHAANLVIQILCTNAYDMMWYHAMSQNLFNAILQSTFLEVLCKIIISKNIT